MLGEKLRVKRTQRNLSLRQLAEQTDLTPSFLSQVERNLASPSITSLRRISAALGVPIFYFLLEDEAGKQVVRRDERKTLNFPESLLTFELLSPGLSHKMEVIMARLQPGHATCDRQLSHAGEECVVVLEGAMDIQIADENHHLAAGDSIYYLSSLPHRIVSTDKEKDLVFLSAITPPNF